MEQSYCPGYRGRMGEHRVACPFCIGWDEASLGTKFERRRVWHASASPSSPVDVRLPVGTPMRERLLAHGCPVSVRRGT
jgi:hypothetical protein